MEMSRIQECDVSQCCYNADSKCHALAITVGDTVPRCDTFTTACTAKAGDTAAFGAVGACKVSKCRYNMKLECQAGGIKVGLGSNEADCLTFEPS